MIASYPSLVQTVTRFAVPTAGSNNHRQCLHVPHIISIHRCIDVRSLGGVTNALTPTRTDLVGFMGTQVLLELVDLF